jgi:hypothetical protein
MDTGLRLRDYTGRDAGQTAKHSSDNCCIRNADVTLISFRSRSTVARRTACKRLCKPSRPGTWSHPRWARTPAGPIAVCGVTWSAQAQLYPHAGRLSTRAGGPELEFGRAGPTCAPPLPPPFVPPSPGGGHRRHDRTQAPG